MPSIFIFFCRVLLRLFLYHTTLQARHMRCVSHGGTTAVTLQWARNVTTKSDASVFACVRKRAILNNLDWLVQQ